MAADRGRPLRPADDAPWQPGAGSSGWFRGVDRRARRSGSAAMNAPVIIGVPSKGRLMENAHAFFRRAGMSLVQPRGGRDYRGTIPEIEGIEVAYLSAAEIAGNLAQGTIHLGVTGEDLVREMIPEVDTRVLLVEGLGFGHA